MNWLRCGRGCLVLVLVAAVLVVAGCGSKSSSSSTASGGGSSTSAAVSRSGSSVGHLPTAKFVLHAGLAFGAFHRYIYKPFKAGSFTGASLLKHKAAIVKAGLAGLFAYHELKLALADAKASPILSKLLTPVDALAAKLSTLGSRLKGGHIDGSSITSANADVTNLAAQAHQSGASISDHVLSAGQLAAG